MPSGQFSKGADRGLSTHEETLNASDRRESIRLWRCGGARCCPMVEDSTARNATDRRRQARSDGAGAKNSRRSAELVRNLAATRCEIYDESRRRWRRGPIPTLDGNALQTAASQ